MIAHRRPGSRFVCELPPGKSRFIEMNGTTCVLTCDHEGPPRIIEVSGDGRINVTPIEPVAHGVSIPVRFENRIP